MTLNRVQDFMFDNSTSLTTNSKSVKGAINEVSAQLADISIDVENYYSGGNTDTQAVLAAINDCPNGGIVRFKPGKTYTLGSLGTLSKLITLDFNGAVIALNGTGTFLVYQPANASDRAVYRPPVFKGAKFTSASGGSNFDSVIVIGNTTIGDAVNALVDECKFYMVTANHSLIRNVSGYGNVFNRVKIYNCTVPHGIYFNQYAGAYDGNYTFNNVVRDLDITNFTGVGVGIEGGALTIEGSSVVESCSGGGIEWLGTATLYSLDIDGVYFEANSNFDIKLFNSNPAAYQANVVDIRNCRHFGGTSLNKILLGKSVNLVTRCNFYQHGGIFGDAGGVNGSTYHGTANQCSDSQSGLQGWTSKTELNDSLYGNIPTIINGFRYGQGYTSIVDILEVKGVKFRSFKQDIDPTPVGNYNIGDQILNKNAFGGLKNISLICTSAGTQDTLSGVTGTGTSGSNALTVNSIPTNLVVNSYISISGVTGTYQVTYLDATNKIVYLASNLVSSCTAATVSFVLPLFKSTGTPAQKNIYTIASGAVQTTDFSVASLTGLMNVMNATDGTMALFAVSASTSGGANYVTMISNPNGAFSTTQGNANTINIYYTPGYGVQIQNNLAASKSIRYHIGVGL